jgi:hypothetical protein
VPAPVAYPQSDFSGGLMLRDGVTLLDERFAVDLANVRFSRRGDLRRRDGLAHFDALSLPSSAYGMVQSQAGGVDRLLLQHGTTQMVARNLDSALSTTEVVSANEYSTFAHFGDPNAARTFFANAYDFGYWDGTAWSVNATLSTKATEGTAAFTAGQAAPRPRALAVTPWDNRLMCCGFRATALGPGASANSSPSTIFFSYPGNPLQYVLTAYQHLAPGDGEYLAAAVRWRDLVFVFKQSKFFVYYGTRDGVYRTTGAEPELISDAISPLFQGGELLSYSGDSVYQARMERAQMAAVGDEVFVSVPTGESGYPDETFVYDRRTGSWVRDSYGLRSICRSVRNGREVLEGAQDSPGVGDVYLVRLDRDTDADRSIDIDAFWQSGWSTIGADTEKVIRRTQFWGRGQLLYSHGFDYESLYEVGSVDFDSGLPEWPDGFGGEWPDGGGDDVWPIGGAGRYSNIMLDHGYRGEVYAYRIENVGGSDFTVQRLEHHVKQRPHAAAQTAGA